MEVTLERYLLAVIPSKKYFTLLKQFREAPAGSALGNCPETTKIVLPNPNSRSSRPKRSAETPVFRLRAFFLLLVNPGTEVQRRFHWGKRP